MISFPYGIADFRRIRQQGRVYVDRTAHIRDIEMLGDVLVFLRPRRFGKSLWLQTLANYYDLRCAEELDELFSGLVIGHSLAPQGLSPTVRLRRSRRRRFPRAAR
ncbi:MAG: AAA family ATPase [bacterium]|nr:AAA family ATPase [bacterium]